MKLVRFGQYSIKDLDRYCKSLYSKLSTGYEPRTFFDRRKQKYTSISRYVGYTKAQTYLSGNDNLRHATIDLADAYLSMGKRVLVITSRIESLHELTKLAKTSMPEVKVTAVQANVNGRTTRCITDDNNRFIIGTQACVQNAMSATRTMFDTVIVMHPFSDCRLLNALYGRCDELVNLSPECVDIGEGSKRHVIKHIKQSTFPVRIIQEKISLIHGVG